ncbi:MAG: nucleotidyltransferase family protein [Candidatus Micrarchaeia archaeon]
MELEDAIILAGGKGTRLRPLTFEVPKPLIKINGKPLIEYAVEELERNGIKNIYLSLGYKSNKIIDYFNKRHKFGARIEFIIESKPLGTGGAIRYAMSKMQRYEDVAVVYADTVYRFDLKQMHTLHKARNALVTIGTVEMEDIRGFGVLETADSKVVNFVEKPDPKSVQSRTVSAGVYILSKIVEEKLPKSEAFSFEKDFLSKACKEENILHFPIERFITVNNIEQYKIAKNMLKFAGGEI